MTLKNPSTPFLRPKDQIFWLEWIIKFSPLQRQFMHGVLPLFEASSRLPQQSTDLGDEGAVSLCERAGL